jgi:predicted Zn-dependent protease
MAVGFKDGGEFGNIEWYIKQAYNSQRKQCDLIKFIDLFKREPWQKLPHYDLLLLSSYDLYDSTAPEIKFFTSRGSINATVISIYRIKKHGSEVMKQVGVHEFGHTYGSLPDCTNICSMRSPELIPSDFDNSL